MTPLFDSPHPRSENLETHRDDPHSFTPITHGKDLATKLRTAQGCFVSDSFSNPLSMSHSVNRSGQRATALGLALWR